MFILDDVLEYLYTHKVLTPTKLLDAIWAHEAWEVEVEECTSYAESGDYVRSCRAWKAEAKECTPYAERDDPENEEFRRILAICKLFREAANEDLEDTLKDVLEDSYREHAPISMRRDKDILVSRLEQCKRDREYNRAHYGSIPYAEEIVLKQK